MKDNLKDVGIWGQRHYQYLKECKPSVIGVMRLNGSLNAYLQQVNEQADEMCYRLVKQMAKDEGVETVYVHCFLDGRDVPPRCAVTYMDMLTEHMEKVGLGQVGIVSGRYYAMDRDKRWERLVKAYDAMTINEGLHAATGQQAILDAYERDENDEFVLPTVVDSEKYPNGFVNDGLRVGRH